VAKFRERLSINKQRPHNSIWEMFNLKLLNKVEGKDKSHLEVSNMFAAYDDLDAEVEINSVWETIRENIKISGEKIIYRIKNGRNIGFHRGCSKLLDQRKQAKLQWLQNPSVIIRDIYIYIYIYIYLTAIEF
jgi:hypothetical protein